MSIFDYYDYETNFPSSDKIISLNEGFFQDVIDREMDSGKHKRAIVLRGFGQKEFEYFIGKYGREYECIVLDVSNLISDFSPFEDLEKLVRVDIKWNIRAKELWNMKNNSALKMIVSKDWKKGSWCPDKLKTSSTIEYVEFWGPCFSRYPMESLECFSGISSLKGICIEQIKPVDRNTDFLSTLPSFEEFHFDPSMFTVDEIAYMCAKYPHVSGMYLKAYNDNEIGCDVRVSGSRKPELFFPEDRHKLDKYVREFEALVEKYKNEN